MSQVQPQKALAATAASCTARDAEQLPHQKKLVQLQLQAAQLEQAAQLNPPPVVYLN